MSDNMFTETVEDTPVPVPVRRMPHDGRGGAADLFHTRLQRVTLPSAVTHCLLTGGGRGGKQRGRLHIPYSEERAFLSALAKDAEQGTMLPICTIRTVVFRFYADLDLKLPVRVIPPEALRRMARVMNVQAQRFFPEGHAPLVCVVCDKTRDADSERAAEVIGALHKHGVHLHWPDVCVKQDGALRMRASMVAALDRETWEADLGVSKVDWADVFDESVYGTPSERASGGLRVVGAPKASLCPECKNVSDRVSRCETCFKRGHVIDERHYKLFEVLRGDGVDEEWTRRLRNSWYMLLQMTNIRSDPDAHDTTDGWLPYVGCPAPEPKDERGRKRKSDGIERKFKSKPEVVDPRVETVVSRLLTRFSPNYERSSFRMYFDGQQYKIPLRGDGSCFCLNKNDFHTSQNVFMAIRPMFKQASEYVAEMGCFCACKKVRRTGIECRDFRSRHIRITGDEARILFPKK